MSIKARKAAGGHDTPALPLEEARARILAAVDPLTDIETVNLHQALHRVLAEPVAAAIDVPAHTNSAMDGYALRGTDVAEPGTALKLVGESFAGRPYQGLVGPGECVRIMTGAVVPEGSDTVIMQEQTARDGDQVRFEKPAKPGANVRPAGEDLARGDTALHPGRWLTPADLGVLASVGVPEVRVKRNPKVAFFSTGDELKPVGETLAPGQIHDSNRYTLFGMLSELGVEIEDLGIVPDQREALDEALQKASRCDAVLSTGGASVGDADYVVEALEKLGNVGFWQVAMKPGRPLAFGKINQAWFFGLPGNPVSAMVTFLQLVRPALVTLAGARPMLPLQMLLPVTDAIRKRPGRREFQRGRLVAADQGQAVSPFGHQGSGVLRSMSEADCLINLGPDVGDVAAGETVVVEPFAQPVWNGA
ncbi:gephyrin-like molybdotransferase Glp [Wenzhouxiangella limi]|uniref:Molybdopterin molybdenumtransferase n=1 Tax=Wenzhouxiangella limi TaxID=2707351 RepID=A0A845UVZ8_9GAMM|nr:gephyrin-like molybdotransferase Glp [Wenzhouxiangella limi]NDY95637.1 molybdopterin molybdotransferase MoeA [Wenzhouxiangella limi]